MLNKKFFKKIFFSPYSSSESSQTCQAQNYKQNKCESLLEAEAYKLKKLHSHLIIIIKTDQHKLKKFKYILEKPKNNLNTYKLLLASVNGVGTTGPLTNEDIDMDMPEAKLVPTGFGTILGVDELFNAFKLIPGKRAGPALIGDVICWAVGGVDMLGNVALNRGALVAGLPNEAVVGDTTLAAGSMSKDAGRLAGNMVCPWVNTFLIRKQAMLNSFLSSLPSLFRSARFHTAPKTLVGRFDLRKNSRVLSPVRKPPAGPSCMNDESCFVRSSMLTRQKSTLFIVCMNSIRLV